MYLWIVVFLIGHQSQIKHARANNFHAANLNFNEGAGSSTQSSGIVVSITNSLNTGEAAAFQFNGMIIINSASTIVLWFLG